MKQLFYILTVIALTSCGGPHTNIPDDIKYEIIDEGRYDWLNKCKLNIRLNKKVDEQVLKDIAMALREDRKKFENLYIGYLLPDMEPGAGAWATTHFTPDLEIKILGATKEEDKMLDEIPMPEGEIIGKWRDETLMIESVEIIYKADGKVRIQTTYKDGSQSDYELTEKQENGKTRYDFVDISRDEYFIVEDNGNLGMYGENGKFKEAKKMK